MVIQSLRPQQTRIPCSDETIAADLLVGYIGLILGGKLLPFHEHQIRVLVRSLVDAATHRAVEEMKRELMTRGL